MTDCPGLNVVMGHGWNEQQHCPGCAENAQLRAQLAQHAAGLTRLRALTDKWDRPFRAGSCCMQAADGAVFDCMLELHVALAGLPDEKEKP